MGKGNMAKLLQRLVSVGSTRNQNKELPEKVSVLVYDETRDGDKRLFGCDSTCEEICQTLGRQLSLTPVMLHCFSLVAYSGRSDSQGLWLGPADIPHRLVAASAKADIQVHFRMRFLPDRDKCSKLNSLDPVCFKYLCWQVKWDFIHDKLELYTRKDKQENSRGVVVVCILIMLRLETERSGSETDDLKLFLKNNNINKQFIPNSLEGNFFDNTYQHKGILGKIEKELEKRYPLSSLILAFIRQLLEEKQFYYEERYDAVVAVQRGHAQVNCDVRVCIQLGGQLQSVTILNKATGSTQFKCAVSELTEVTMTPLADGTWEVNLRKSAQPQMLCFASEREAVACLSCLDSYYRLLLDYTFSLCSRWDAERKRESRSGLEPADFELLKKLSAHGPISDSYVQQKFAKREKVSNCGSKRDVYILRTSPERYNVYDILCTDDRSSKLIKHSLVKEEGGERYLLEGEGEPDDVRVLIHRAMSPRGKVPMQSEGLDILQDLLLAENQVDLKEEVEVETCARVYTDSALTIANLIGQGHFTETYEATLKNGENVVAKRLRYSDIPDDSFRHVQEAFQASCDVLLTLQNPKFFVEFKGVVMSRTPTMLMGLCKYGSLRTFLQSLEPREHMLTMRHLCDVVVKLISALEYLVDKNLCHGNLHCDNILVSKFDRHELSVDIGDPGLVSLYNKLGLESHINRRRLPWLAPELHENLFSMSLKSDMFALGTTMWQVFTEGKNPLDYDPKLKRKSSQEVREFFCGEVCHLSCPAYLRDRKDDGPEIQMLKKKLYEEVICPCWTVSPEDRIDPKSLLRAYNNLVQSYSTDYHDYNMIPEWSTSEASGSKSGASFTSGSRGNSTSGMAASIQTRSSPVDDLQILYRRGGPPQIDTDREEPALKLRHNTAATPSREPAPANSQLVPPAANTPPGNNNNSPSTVPGSSPSPESTTALSPWVLRNGDATGGPGGHVPAGRTGRTGRLPSVPGVSNVRYLIPEGRLNIDKSHCVGQGHYGAIYEGTLAPTSSLNLLEPTKVAVKELKTDIASYGEEFKEEARVMEQLDHKNIVKFYGICKDRYLVMEYVENKCLYKFVSREGDRCAPETLLKFCVDIAAGMEYLSSKNVLHRDLAARNVLITQSLDAKISDFGISKILGEGEDYYRRDRNVNKNVPILWSAPEWIGKKKFTTKSDVWSFAVTLWEVYSKGSVPNICRDMDEFKNQGIKWLAEGRRLKKPTKCSEVVYALMLECWNHENPDRRPSFTQCHTRLRAIAGMPDHLEDQPEDYSKTNLINDTEPNVVVAANTTPPPAPDNILPRPVVANDNGRIVANANSTDPLGQQGGRMDARRSEGVSSVPNLNGRTERTLTVDTNNRLGSGSFGAVYKGTLQGRDVAVKRCTRDEEYPRFTREMDLLYKLTHQNIVRFEDKNLYDGEKFQYAMEYMPLGSLSHHLKKEAAKGQPIEPTVKIKVLIDIAKGLAYLYKEKILHCDLTADNVLLSGTMTAKISDFGFAKDLSDKDVNMTYHRNDPRFKLEWAALEVLKTHVYYPESDVWSYGTLVLEVFGDGRIPDLDPPLRVSKPTQGHHGRAGDQGQDRGQVLLERLEKGHRYRQPDRCPNNIYREIALRCWAAKPKLRIKCDEIVDKLSRLPAIPGLPDLEMGNHLDDQPDYSKTNLNNNLINNTEPKVVVAANTAPPPPDDILQRLVVANDNRRIVGNANSTDPLAQQRSQVDVHGNEGMSSVPNLNGRTERKLSVYTNNRLGSGSFGAVYKGSLQGLDVAVKRCTKDEEYPRFTREMDLLHKLIHPNIVRFKWKDFYDGEKFQYAMEYMPLGSLSHHLRKAATRGQPVEPTTKIDILIDIAKGLAFLYKEGILHCDLTADNVLLSGSMTAKISDFGFAKDLGDKDKNTTYRRNDPRLKLEWAAIEVLKTQIYHRESDIWSYGALVLEVFSDAKIPDLDPPLRVSKPAQGHHGGAGDQGQTRGQVLLERLERGDRYKKPDRCPDRVYREIALRCWVEKPELRIKCDKIVDKLSSINLTNEM